MHDIDEFLASDTSVGPLETNTGRTEFTSHEAADLDVKFLQALISQNHRLSVAICKARFFLCASDTAFEFSDSRCAASYPWKMFNGCVIYDVATHPTLVLPPDLPSRIARCHRRGERFLVLGFGLYPTRDLEVGHSNALIFDVTSRVIERYEPSGITNKRLDGVMKSAFRQRLRDWTYVGHTGTQEMADSYEGMCVTFSLLYVLLRLLNPDTTASNIRKHIVTRTRDGTLQTDVLRLNRFVADTLRKYRRGTLVQRGGARGRRSTFGDRVHRDREVTHEALFVRRRMRSRPTSPSKLTPQRFQEWLVVGRRMSHALLLAATV